MVVNSGFRHFHKLCSFLCNCVLRTNVLVCHLRFRNVEFWTFCFEFWYCCIFLINTCTYWQWYPSLDFCHFFCFVVCWECLITLISVFSNIHLFNVNFFIFNYLFAVKIYGQAFDIILCLKRRSNRRWFIWVQSAALREVLIWKGCKNLINQI